MTAFVVFNPNSANGKTGQDWQAIEAALEKIFPLMTFFVTTAPAQAAHMVRDALRDGHMEIIAVGGDGTINEALNGFFDRGVSVAPDAVFSFVHNGHDSDLCRRLGVLPGWRAGVAHLAHARIHKRDLGRVACLSAEGQPVMRYFLGGASFGLSAATARAFGRARIARFFGHRFATALHQLVARRRWHATRVRLMSEGQDEIAGIASVSVSPKQGRFDMRVLAGRGRADQPRGFRVARLTAAPTVDTAAPVDVECDGEATGVLPATFEIIAAAINLRI
jgi:diacylglycerol kinase (ATP)